MVPAQAEFAGHRGRRTTGGLPESEGFQLELFGESLSFRHRTPPRGYCRLFEVSTKVGLAQPDTFFCPPFLPPEAKVRANKKTPLAKHLGTLLDYQCPPWSSTSPHR